jgi:anti-anti-sigma regulatory factor
VSVPDLTHSISSHSISSHSISSHSMQLAVDAEPGLSVVHVSGELTARTGPRLLGLIDDVVRRLAQRPTDRPRRLLVELSGVRLFEFDGVAVLRDAGERCAAAQVEMGLSGVSDRRGVLPLRVEELLDELETGGTPLAAR